jgi:hypothetical protein
MGAKFPVHGVANHVLLRLTWSNLAKPKSTLFVAAFYSHNLVWLPRVTKRTCLGMILNPLVFQGAYKGECHLVREANPSGVWCSLGDQHKVGQENCLRFLLHLKGWSLGCELYLSQELATFLKA